MFFACGVSAYTAGIFHLMTHAFFKALLFLGSGSVIHAMSDEQDMRKMGGLWRLIPVTYVLMWIGSLALAGIWPFAGYFSKDLIIEAAWGSDTGVGTLAFWLGIAAAFLTAFYSWRLLIMTFHGRPRCRRERHGARARVAEGDAGPDDGPGRRCGVRRLHRLRADASATTRAPSGATSIFVLPDHPALENAHHAPLWVKLAPLVVGLAGIALAYVMYVARHRPAGHAGGALPGRLPLPAQQVVLRRALRRDLRPPGVQPRPRPVEGRGTAP